MQIGEASFQEPLIEQIMRHNLDRLLISKVLVGKLISRHLVETFAELADGVRNGRRALKHLSCDSVDYI